MACTLFPTLPLCIMLILCHVGIDGVTVHFTTPGGHKAGKFSEVAGVYRARVDMDALIANNGTFKDEAITKSDFICWTSVDGRSSSQGFAVSSLSYDVVTNQTNMQIDRMNRAVATVFYGSTCDPQTQCNQYDKMTSLMYTLATKSGGYIKPVASHNGTWYFAYRPYAEERSLYFGYMQYLELRKIKTDHEFSSMSATDHEDVNSFSTVVVNLTSQDGHWMQPGSSLFVVPQMNGGVVLLLAVRAVIYENPPQNTSVKEFSYKLFAIRLSTSEVGVARSIQTVTANIQWYSHAVSAEGGISYLDGTLCWSALDEIWCGKWSPDEALAALKSPTREVARGDATHVCEGPWFNDLYVNAITGVAISEVPTMAAGRQAIFFGCFASLAARGGLGVHVTTSSSEQKIIAVKDKGGALRAGSMFVTPDDMCPSLASATDDQNKPVSSANVVVGNFQFALAILMFACNVLHYN